MRASQATVDELDRWMRNDPAVETHRRDFALVGARSIPSPFFYDVSVGPGFWRRRWPASGGGDSGIAFSVQGSVGIAF